MEQYRDLNADTNDHSFHHSNVRISTFSCQLCQFKHVVIREEFGEPDVVLKRCPYHPGPIRKTLRLRDPLLFLLFEVLDDGPQRPKNDYGTNLSLQTVLI